MPKSDHPLRKKPAGIGVQPRVRSSVLGLLAVVILSIGGRSFLSGGLSGLSAAIDIRGGLTDFGTAAAVDAAFASDLVLRNADIHPSRIYNQYLSYQPNIPDATTARIARGFQHLIGLYEIRQGVDDNFTLRVLDNRTGELIEVVVLDSLREEYRRTGTANWQNIDAARRSKTSELVRKHSANIDRGFITVKWGRRNEILDARKRELPVVEHEVRLARAFGLSLLTTEIGTVETFNDDNLVSRVGARSRYQLMPSILRELDVNHYTLRTATGRPVTVKEELHPLNSMEAAYTVVRAYSNAMGHEIPGISAYHTGPFNVFRVYEKFLDPSNDLFNPYSNVVTAYFWGLTEGFDQVTENSSFGPNSRNYVPSIFGALEATADLPIDTSATWIVESVRLNSGKSIFLSDLLSLVDQVSTPLSWRADASDSTSYQRFKRINPHMSLPDVAGDIIPEKADVKLVDRVSRSPVRFYLPLGSSDRINAIDSTLLDLSTVKPWDHGPFYGENEITDADRRYQDLVAVAEDFSFSNEAVAELDSLYFEFQSLARSTPTWFRTTQYDVIRLHRRIWRASNFERLEKAVAAAKLRVNNVPRARLPEFSLMTEKPIDAVPSKVLD